MTSVSCRNNKRPGVVGTGGNCLDCKLIYHNIRKRARLLDFKMITRLTPLSPTYSVLESLSDRLLVVAMIQLRFEKPQSLSNEPGKPAVHSASDDFHSETLQDPIYDHECP